MALQFSAKSFWSNFKKTADFSCPKKDVDLFRVKKSSGSRGVVYIYTPSPKI
jgi:hypothetical protein